jgi:hypothetical protein
MAHSVPVLKQFRASGGLSSPIPITIFNVVDILAAAIAAHWRIFCQLIYVKGRDLRIPLI